MPGHLKHILFPAAPRQFRGQRWINIGLRSSHLVGVAGIAGGFLFSLDMDAWRHYWILTLVSGVALSLLYLWTTAAWLFELKGLVIVIKTLLLAVALHYSDYRAPLFVMIILLSAISAHAPARLRGYRWIGERTR